MDDIEARLGAFADRNKLRILGRIGFGIHGQVFAVQGGGQFPSALKLFGSKDFYFRERQVYQRLQTAGVMEGAGCAVPGMIGTSDRDLAVWMTLVSRPFCLDFAEAYLDSLPPNFPPFDAAWEAEKVALFGADWEKVRRVLLSLESQGVFQTDVSPTNIAV